MICKYCCNDRFQESLPTPGRGHGGSSGGSWKWTLPCSIPPFLGISTRDPVFLTSCLLIRQGGYAQSVIDGVCANKAQSDGDRLFLTCPVLASLCGSDSSEALVICGPGLSNEEHYKSMPRLPVCLRKNVYTKGTTQASTTERAISSKVGIGSFCRAYSHVSILVSAWVSE